MPFFGIIKTIFGIINLIKTYSQTLKSIYVYNSCHNGFPLDLDDHKYNNGVTTDLFCTGVIGHPRHLFLNLGPKSLFKNDMTGLQNGFGNSKSGSTITRKKGLAPSRRPFENGTN